MFREIFFGGEENFSRKVVGFHAAIFFAAVLFVYLFSTSTSPRYNSLGDDSAIFQTVGMGWAQGYLPYVDLFENKGALIFFVDALGYMIRPREGIMLLQIPAMYVAMLLAWRALGIFLSGKFKVAAAIFMIIFCALYSLDGNRTEEWSMPFLMAATYFFLRGLREKNFFCTPLIGFVYGVGFGACILLRTTNALSLCCCAFLSAIFLLKDGNGKSLPKIFLTFCAGVAVSVMPFVIYFAAHDALDAALYGTILLNVAYSAQRENFLLTHLGDFAEYVAVNFMMLYVMIAVSALELIKNKSRLALSGLFCGAVMLFMMIKLSPYSGYCALIVPLLPIFFAVTTDFAKNFRALWSEKIFSLKRTACKFIVIPISIYLAVIGYAFAGKFYEVNSQLEFETNRDDISEMLRLEKIIPPEERNSVMMWGEGLQVSQWILTTGIFPRCRFFGNVKAFADVDPLVKREWLKSARDNPPQWIICSLHGNEVFGTPTNAWIRNFRKNRDLDVEKFLAEKYSLAGEAELRQDFFRLYRLRRD